MESYYEYFYHEYMDTSSNDEKIPMIATTLVCLDVEKNALPCHRFST
jgi:hypothetical protein